jgi:hypothetical protein
MQLCATHSGQTERVKRLLALALFPLLGLAACGGSDSDSGGSANDDSTESTESGDSTESTEAPDLDVPDLDAPDLDADEQEYADALAEGLKNSDEAPPASDEQVQCFADQIVAIVGVDTLAEEGTPDDYADPDTADDLLSDYEFSDDQALEAADAFFGCLDFGALLAEQFEGEGESGHGDAGERRFQGRVRAQHQR